MPRKDKEAYREYMREWYARPENRKRVIAKVAARKHDQYAGVCVNCGGPTVGTSKGKAPWWCSRTECRRTQRQWANQQSKLWRKKRPQVVGLDELL